MQPSLSAFPANKSHCALTELVRRFFASILRRLKWKAGLKQKPANYGLVSKLHSPRWKEIKVFQDEQPSED